MKLGVFFFGSRHELTGAGAVVRSFADSENIFISNDVERVRIYDALQIKGNTDNAGQTFTKKYIKKCVSNLLQKTGYGSNKLIEKLYFAKGQRVVDRYFFNAEQDDDVLIFHEIFTCVSYVEKCTAEGMKIKPFVLVMHTNGEVFKMLRVYYPHFAFSRYEKIIENRILNIFNIAKKIVFVSQSSCSHFSEVYPKYKDKAVVVYNGIAKSKIEYRPNYDGKVRMVTVGTVNARKNQKMIIECMGRLKNPDLYLTVIGGGNLLNYCKELASQYGITDHIEFLGPRRDVALLLAKSNVFVMSSLDEGLPISAIEAMRAKLPLILTDVGGNKELIDGNGYLISPNIEDLCIAIEKFAKDTNNQLYMSNKSLEIFLQNFTVNRMIEEYCKVIKKEK